MGFFKLVIPTQKFAQSRNPEGYFWLPTFRAYFQSRISPRFCFNIPNPERKGNFRIPLNILGNRDPLLTNILFSPAKKCVWGRKLFTKSNFQYLFWGKEKLFFRPYDVLSSTTSHIPTVNRTCVENVGYHGNHARVEPAGVFNWCSNVDLVNVSDILSHRQHVLNS